MLNRGELAAAALVLSGSILACSGSGTGGDTADSDSPVGANDAGNARPDAATPGDGGGGGDSVDGGAPREGDASTLPPAEPWPVCDGCTASAPLLPSSPWPKFRGNMRQTGATTLVPSRSHGKPWSYRTGKGIFSSPIVGSDGAIYIGSADRSFYALEHDGTLRFKVETGEIIDSAGLLDDKGRVYFASGDGILRALDARSGAELWRFHAEDPSVNDALINWFEGNVAIGPSGRLYAPNDNFSVYAIDRDDGEMDWKWLMNDQTWSLPAVDPDTSTLYIGNNYIAGLDVIGLFYKNIFAIEDQGTTHRQVWRQGVNATIAASPLLWDQHVYMGAFDGYLRAYDKQSGSERWSVPTIDHVYASPARLPGGDIVQPSADGTVYCLDAATGAVRWRFDTREPIRSSPAVDGEGHIYFGGGDGRLYVLNADGSRRFSIKLVDEDRNDLNSSPAIGFDAIYIGAENGEIWSVPYDYCLDAGKLDPRCETSAQEDLADEGARLYFVSPFGSSLERAPSSVAKNQPLALSLFVRSAGDTELALIDESSLTVSLEPESEARVLVSGDRRFLTITPSPEFAGDSLRVRVRGNYLTEPTREGLKLTGGTVAGSFDQAFDFALESGTAPANLPVPARVGEPAGTLELLRSAVPLPTILPSYNQIGFDSLHYLVGFVAGEGEQALGWVVGGMLDAQGNTVPDPNTQVLFPVSIHKRAGLLTLENESGFTVNAMNADIPFDTFRASAMWSEASAERASTRNLHVTTDCRNIPTYGSFLVALGFCNPESGLLNVFGSFDLRRHESGITHMPEGVGQVAFDVVAAGLTTPRRLRATLTNSTLKSSEHSLSLLVVDAATQRPLALPYGLSTERTASREGNALTVSVPLDGTAPETVTVYLMVDTYPVASTSLRLLQ